MEWLGIEVIAEDVLDIFDSFDSDRDGKLNYREFLELVRKPGATLEQLEQEDEGNEVKQI
jgi:Ca2+-binding EF-hand superfamily protein